MSTSPTAAALARLNRMIDGRDAYLAENLLDVPRTAVALIATTVSGEERTTVSILDPDGWEYAKLDLGEWAYLS